MSGIYLQWINDNQVDLDLSIYEKDILFTISRNTLGYRLSYGYILQELFTLLFSERTLKTYRKKLIEKGLLKFKPTNRMSYYELVLPDEITNEFDFIYVKDPIAYATRYIKQYIGKYKIDKNELISLKSNPQFKGLYKRDEAIDKIIAEYDSEKAKNKKKFNDNF